MILEQEHQDVFRDNICYLATSSGDGRPNVVPVGLVSSLDGKLVIVDVYFNKTRKNLEANDQVAVAATDFSRRKSFQLKGKGTIVTSGKFFDFGLEMIREKIEKIKKEGKKPHFSENIRPKGVLVIDVEELHSNMRGSRS
jgi:predicted pyridoxine 5'-phosphate oxidase superfamily flavin-nucleotide-binding protein